MSVTALLTAAGFLLQGGSTIASGMMQNKATDKYNTIMEKYYNEETAEKKRQSRVAEANAQRTLNLNEKTARWQKEQLDVENKRIQNETNYNRLQKAADKFAEYLNTKTAVTANRMSGFQGR